MTFGDYSTSIGGQPAAQGDDDDDDDDEEYIYDPFALPDEEETSETFYG